MDIRSFLYHRRNMGTSVHYCDSSGDSDMRVDSVDTEKKAIA